jgi:inner membrane protein
MRNSAIARLVAMGFLTLALIIPLSMVSGIVGERTSRRNEAVTSVSSDWGGPQNVSGPVLTIPYTWTWTDSAGQSQTTTRRAHVLPKDLLFDAALNTHTRNRGIFDVVVYQTELKVTGRFERPDLSWIQPASATIHWPEATLSVWVSDPRALTRRAAIEWNGVSQPFTSGVADIGLFNAGVQAPARGLESIKPGSDIRFAFAIALNGTRDIRFLPSAEETIVSLTSNWQHPSYVGRPLPESRTTTAQGFTAKWRVTDFGRPFPARWSCVNVDSNCSQFPERAAGAVFGVSLIQPVDIYQQAERAVKYAVLFLVPTFLVFFLWEIFRAVLLHPVQYAFVGFAMCLFYLLLVSISEHAGFDIAYAISATVTTLAIAGYARAVLRGSRQGASIAAALAALFGFLFLLLRLEDYALLAGSVGLFAVLSAVMYITRRMNWYELRLGGAE